MKKILEKDNKKTIIFTVLLFLIFAALVYLFPYSGDDWAWGSQLGLERLESHFANYNGRYAGNLLVLLLTRSKLLNMLVMGISLVGVCYFPKVLANSRSLSTYVLGTLLFLLVPRQIFVQAVVWTAGYSNYIPPILMTMLYFIIVRDIFEEEKPKHYHWAKTIIVFCLGFVSALFMENVTLYNICISALIVLYVFIKFKKAYWTHAAHFIGSVAGAVLMFTNSAYTSIANESDGYRSTAFDSGLLATIVDHTKVIYQQIFENNLIVLGILSILCVAVYLLFMKEDSNPFKKKAAAIAVILNVFSFGIMFAKKQYTHWAFFIENPHSNTITIAIFALTAAVYFASIVCIVFCCVTEDKDKYKMLLLLLSIPVLVAPLLIVNPIGPRCFFPPYFMLTASCVLLWAYLEEKTEMMHHIENGLTIMLFSGCFACLVFIFSMYSTIHNYEMKRNEYVKKQVEAGYDTAVVCKLPYGSQVWTGDPTSGIWEERYKYFYNIDQEVEFELVDYKAFDKWMEQFDKEVTEK